MAKKRITKKKSARRTTATRKTVSAKRKRIVGTTPRVAVTPSSSKKRSQGAAIAGLLLNVLVLPGVGTIVGGDTRKGILQLVLFLVGIPLILVVVGLFLMFGVWIWALVTSIQQIQETQ